VRPGGTDPDRSLRTPSEARALSRTTGRTRNLERRFVADSSSLIVSDGTTTVDPVTEIDFTGATVTDEGGGVAGVDVIGGSGVTAITSVDDSVTVDDSGFPTDDLSVFTTCAHYASSNVSLAGGANHTFNNTDFTFENGDSGLVDLTTMLVATPGVYAVTACGGNQVGSGSPGTQPFFAILLYTDNGGSFPLLSQATGPTTIEADQSTTIIGLVGTGDIIRIEIKNFDSTTRNFNCRFMIAKIGGDRT
jgi:hypothetical protein